MEITVHSSIPLRTVCEAFTLPMPIVKAANKQIDGEIVTQGSRLHIPGYQLLNKSIANQTELLSIMQQYQVNKQQVEIVNTWPIIQQLHIPTRFIIETDATSIYTYQVLQAEIAQLQQHYPFIKTNVIGHSVLGKEITELRIGNGPRLIHFNAAFHGNEWITTSTLMYCVKHYINLLTSMNRTEANKACRWFEQTTLSIVPMVNPDGVDLVIEGDHAAERYQAKVRAINDNQADYTKWKANIRGVDLNKQFPAGWEIEAARKPKQPHYRDFPGFQPLTEPESIAMTALAENNAFDLLHAVHTQGEEIYWGFQNLEPTISEKIADLYAEITGYEPMPYIDNYAGYKDWFIQTYRKPGFTLELGSGTNPLPIEQLDQMNAELLRIFYASLDIS